MYLVPAYYRLGSVASSDQAGSQRAQTELRILLAGITTRTLSPTLPLSTRHASSTCTTRNQYTAEQGKQDDVGVDNRCDHAGERDR